MRALLAALLLACAARAAPPPTAQDWLRRLTLAERVAQLVMAPFYGDAPHSRSPAYQEYERLVGELKIGGLIVLNRVEDGVVRRAEPQAMAAFLNRMQRRAQLPLIVGGDFERGASMRLNGTAQFPHAMAFGAAGDLAATRALGAATAREARAVGIHWVFAPDADVNNNPENPIINIRSFSEHPARAAAHVRAFIEGARANPARRVLICAKHFPGHGDTATDSHIGLGRVTASRERLEAVELEPFRAAIAAGADSIMTAHLAVDALETESIPATVSAAILTGLLRKQMGFTGLIATDAMDMQGLAKQFTPGEAAVRALEAGADLLLIPPDPAEAVRAVVQAVRRGRLSRARIDQSVRKILAAKLRLGLDRRRVVDIEAISDAIDTPEDRELAVRVAERALTLVKNEGDAVPLRRPESSCWYLLGAGRFSTQGRELAAGIRRRVPGAAVHRLDPQLPGEEFDRLATGARSCATNFVATYVTAAAYRGDVALAGSYHAFVEKLLASGPPLVFVSFGNPYLLRNYPRASAYLAAFSTAAPSESAALRALLGEIPIGGKLPVTIPGQAEFGAGIALGVPPAPRQ